MKGMISAGVKIIAHNSSGIVSMDDIGLYIGFADLSPCLKADIFFPVVVGHNAV